jgi:predicted transposase/invertase (TIGR01784 family)
MRQLAIMEIEGEIHHSEEKGRIEGIKVGEKKGLKKGIKEGEIKGKKEEKLEIAINMLKKGVDLNLISEVTNLPISKIQNLNSK